jgi:hypothetical protein
MVPGLGYKYLMFHLLLQALRFVGKVLSFKEQVDFFHLNFPSEHS